ncbi:MAG TPA: A/G-specific adenine glycosylase [Gammaproteobacteria bacterium]|nr:A/G-specific adenine glycosylase [Gammaproteobacteria bacterium]
MSPAAFQRRLLAWFDRHGRHDLPWQRNPTPYRVWVSEIMLQQTQVKTVIPYYQRFMKRFRGVRALADAPLDEVLHLWTGLGYYARARNLHRAAQLVRDEHGGRFPRDIDALTTLPGIGRSTAGAILALSAGQRHAILDGNVKRVLTRFHAVDGWPGETAITRELWALSERFTPARRCADYTQAIMDLGATVCTRARPVCETCPVAAGCRAREQGNPEAYPTPKPRAALPVRETVMLVLEDPQGRVLLERRPPAGLWGGLWSLPECAPGTDVHAWCRERLGLAVGECGERPGLRHTFSHFHLDIRVLHARAESADSGVMEADGRVWYNTRRPDARGLSAPVKRLLDDLAAVPAGASAAP